MGTNYYLHRTTACPTCGHKEPPIHIGKSSAGWCFALRVHPDLGIANLSDWVAHFTAPDASIYDEYGDAVLVSEMLAQIQNRSGGHPCNWSPAMLAQNHATHGPNNLLRHVIDGRHCIGHGEGTWDYMQGEFS